MTKEALFKGENVSSLNFINVPMRTGVIIGSPQNSEKGSSKRENADGEDLRQFRVVTTLVMSEPFHRIVEHSNR
jgi:hypothetical protein